MHIVRITFMQFEFCASRFPSSMIFSAKKCLLVLRLKVGLNGDPSSFFSPFPSSLFYASTLRDKSSAGASSRRRCISSKKFSRIMAVCCLRASTFLGALTHSCQFPRKRRRKKRELWPGTKVSRSFPCPLFLLLVEQKPSKFDHRHENLTLNSCF